MHYAPEGSPRGWAFPVLIVVLFLLGMLDAKAIEPDKQQHFAAGMMISGITAAATDSKWKGFLAGCAAGVLKEEYDKRHAWHDPSSKDALATCLGAAVSFTVRF